MSNVRTRPQILLVEDEEWIRDLWVEELAEQGQYDVIGVAGAAAALAVLAAKRLDAAIIDIGLPEMSGEALIAAARTLDPMLPMLAVTGFDATDYGHLADFGVRVLQKPFRTSWLQFNLNTLLIWREHELRRASSTAVSRAVC